MLLSYLPILILLGLAVIVPIGMIVATSLIGPRVSHKVKQAPYECGIPAVGSVRERFPVKFYRIGLLFLVFDVEAAFLFPWAVLFRPKISEWGATFLVFELLIFLLVLFVGYVFAWKKGVLEWD